jgi:hypothetical protein
VQVGGGLHAEEFCDLCSSPGVTIRMISTRGSFPGGKAAGVWS